MVQSTTKPACASAETTGAKPPDCDTCPGRAHRHGLRVARRRHHDVKRARAEAQQRKLGEMHVQRARLRLRQDRRGVARLDGALFEDLAECVDPLSLDAIGEHLISYSGRSGKPTSSRALSALKPAFNTRPNIEIMMMGTYISTV